MDEQINEKGSLKGQPVNYILFNLGSETFGIPIDQVREVIQKPVVNFLPDAPSFLDGVIALHNHSIVAIDLYKRFKIPSTPADSILHHALVVRISSIIIGLLVNKVSHIVDIEEVKIDTTEKTEKNCLGNKVVTGIIQLNEQTIFLLNLSRLLNEEEQKKLEQMRG